VNFFFAKHPVSKQLMGRCSSFICSHKGLERGKTKKSSFSQPYMKLLVKLFYQTVFSKQLSFTEKAVKKISSLVKLSYAKWSLTMIWK
jgi:hypothetical protein